MSQQGKNRWLLVWYLSKHVAAAWMCSCQLVQNIPIKTSATCMFFYSFLSWNPPMNLETRRNTGSTGGWCHWEAPPNWAAVSAAAIPSKHDLNLTIGNYWKEMQVAHGHLSHTHFLFFLDSTWLHYIEPDSQWLGGLSWPSLKWNVLWYYMILYDTIRYYIYIGLYRQ